MNKINITFSLSFINTSWACCSLCVNIFSCTWHFLSTFGLLLFLCILIEIYKCEIFLETCPTSFADASLYAHRTVQVPSCSGCWEHCGCESLFCCAASVGNRKTFASASLAYFCHFSDNLCSWLRCALCAAVAISPAHFYVSLVVTVLPCLGRHVFTGSSFGIVSGPCKSWQQRYARSKGFVTKQKNDN